MKITIEKITIEIDAKEAANILHGAEYPPEMENIKTCILTELSEGLKKHAPSSPVHTPAEP